MQSLNSCVRLTYEHRSPLKQRNCRKSRESANPLNQLNYNESLELANSLIIPKSFNAGHREKREQCSGSGQNGINRGLEAPTNSVKSCGDGRNPDLAYERVVTESHEVNQRSLSKSDRQPSLRGEVQCLCGSLRPAQNSTYEIFVGHSITESNPVQVCKVHRRGLHALNRMLEEMFEESDMWLVKE